MAREPRRARVRALAKLNLALEVLNRRADGYHDLRTIFQTISLADILDIEYTPGVRTEVQIESDLSIPDNLIVRAAKAILDQSRVSGVLRFRLRKRIPMGGGLGGGSTDAASVLLAVPVLTGRAMSMKELTEIGSALGSDVPFFLTGGTALGLGRGTEVYPLADAAASHVLVAAPDIHVSTAEAYSGLRRKLTSPPLSHKINVSQSLALAMAGGLSTGRLADFCSNDFESVVFGRHPELNAIKKKLIEAGAGTVLLTGSGAALFGIFESVDALRRAQRSLGSTKVVPVSFVSRSRYRAIWRRQLAEHIEGNTWPPQSRYAR